MPRFLQRNPFFAWRKTCLFAVFIFGPGLILGLTRSCPAEASSPTDPTAIDPCERHLRGAWFSQTNLILNQINRATIISNTDGSGFRVSLPPPGSTARPITRTVLPSLLHDRSRWNREIWSYEGKEYLFLDIGQKNLQLDSDEVNRIVLDHLANDQGKDLEVLYGAKRITDLILAQHLREVVHSLVLDAYHDEKPYLTGEDFAILEFVNQSLNNSDMFVLMRHDPDLKTWDDLANINNWDERILFTSQINYFESQISDIPSSTSLESLVRSDLQLPPGVERRYPHEYRVKIDQRRQLHDLLALTFNTKTTSEIMRHRKFKKLPRPIDDRFVLKVLDANLRRGMRAILSSLDGSTLRLFKRYGFSKLMDLPIETSMTPEFLAVLRTDSREFMKAYRYLSESSQDVEIRRDNGE